MYRGNLRKLFLHVGKSFIYLRWKVCLFVKGVWIVLRGLNGKEELHVDMTVCHEEYTNIII